MARRKNGEPHISSEVPQEEREGVDRAGYTWMEPADEGAEVPPNADPPESPPQPEPKRD